MMYVRSSDGAVALVLCAMDAADRFFPENRCRSGVSVRQPIPMSLAEREVPDRSVGGAPGHLSGLTPCPGLHRRTLKWLNCMMLLSFGNRGIRGGRVLSHRSGPISQYGEGIP
jgi:hypothetical protein